MYEKRVNIGGRELCPDRLCVDVAAAAFQERQNMLWADGWMGRRCSLPGGSNPVKGHALTLTHSPGMRTGFRETWGGAQMR